MRSRKKEYGIIIIVFLAVIPLFSQHRLSRFDEMIPRCIGPGLPSGRIASIDVVKDSLNVIYVGTATGNLWRSTDKGISWEAIFEDFTGSIGAVAVNQQNPNIIWVGTGEGSPRFGTGLGKGLFKSEDRGKSWKLVGLDQSERIHRIVLDPNDQNIAYIGCLGSAYKDTSERGVYKTSDGGSTFERILFTNKSSGCSDLVLDPSNPDRLIAGMYDYRRLPYHFRSGGSGSGLYLSEDKGKTWKEITDAQGIPNEKKGRIGVSFSKSNPSVVYALIEMARGGLYRSDDGGENWRLINDKHTINVRPFYYTNFRVHPKHENIIFNLHDFLEVSYDSGETFVELSSTDQIHSDFQELWIEPVHGNFMVLGTDGGIAISENGGATWSTVENLPIAQFYYLNFDDNVPYNVIGGLQDNSSWIGPNERWEVSWGTEMAPLTNRGWEKISFGDGYNVLQDSKESNYYYSVMNLHEMFRFDRSTGSLSTITPKHPNNQPLRVNNMATIAVNTREKGTVYFGSQYVHKSSDHGNNWEIISPDLTTNDKRKQLQSTSGGLTLENWGGESHTTISVITPSLSSNGLIWVGTDDGNVQLTRDDGKTWDKVSNNIPDLPAGTYIQDIKVVPFEPAVAYVVANDHRRGNWKDYLYITRDYGKTWQKLQVPSSAGPLRTIEPDTQSDNLLFLGAEFGLFISLDGGKTWENYTNKFPVVSVRSLKIHPSENDLIIGTFGRSAFILDDISPMRFFAEGKNKNLLKLINVSHTIQHYNNLKPDAGSGHAIFRGENEPYGALINMYAPSATEARITIFNKSGEAVREITKFLKKGVNRHYWDFTYAPYPGYGNPNYQYDLIEDYAEGPQVVAGNYFINIKSDSHGKDSIPFSIAPDPRVQYDTTGHSEKLKIAKEVGTLYHVLSESISKIKEIDTSLIN
ncbi:MAG: hypothetical protein AAGH46_03945, partial [Bacteroidota bacterium]